MRKSSSYSHSQAVSPELLALPWTQHPFSCLDCKMRSAYVSRAAQNPESCPSKWTVSWSVENKIQVPDYACSFDRRLGPLPSSVATR